MQDVHYLQFKGRILDGNTGHPKYIKYIPVQYSILQL